MVECGTVKACRIELFGFGRESGNRQRWHELAVACQRATNRLWQLWLVHHASRGSAQLIREHLNRYAAWRLAKDGSEKPAWPVKCHEPPLIVSADAGSYYRVLAREFPELTARTRGLLTNKWQSTVSTRKAARGALPGWVSILFCNEAIPSFTRPVPIPFDKENGKVFRDSDGKLKVEMRLERLVESGKSVIEIGELMLHKRKAASQRAIVERIIDGTYTWKGSSLVYDRGKWYALLSYQMPVRETPALDATKTIRLVPARRKSPWLIVYPTGRHAIKRFGGDAAHVMRARRALEGERATRKAHYRWAGSAQKGHGRGRADAVWTKLSSKWKDFVKRFNHEITTQLVRRAIERGCGRVEYWQPVGSARDKLLLATTGTSQWTHTSWDWHQVGTLLAAKCQEYGLEFVKRQIGRETSDDAQEPGVARDPEVGAARQDARKVEKTSRRQMSGNANRSQET